VPFQLVVPITRQPPDEPVLETLAASAIQIHWNDICRRKALGHVRYLIRQEMTDEATRGFPPLGACILLQKSCRLRLGRRYAARIFPWINLLRGSDPGYARPAAVGSRDLSEQTLKRHSLRLPSASGIRPPLGLRNTGGRCRSVTCHCRTNLGRMAAFQYDECVLPTPSCLSRFSQADVDAVTRLPYLHIGNRRSLARNVTHCACSKKRRGQRPPVLLPGSRETGQIHCQYTYFARL
jgi:hypothetical protein